MVGVGDTARHPSREQSEREEAKRFVQYQPSVSPDAKVVLLFPPNRRGMEVVPALRLCPTVELAASS